jgi:uncharacterized protein
MHLLDRKIISIPHVRQDIDMIFLLASPERAREIKPLLNFYYVGNLPVFSTSAIYNPLSTSRTNSDLNAVQFCDMPWVLIPTTFNISRGNRHDQEQTRLFALGIDAFRLTTQLDRLLLSQDFSSYGATGKLSLTANQHIYRQLDWAQFQQGYVRLIHYTQEKIT